MEYDVILTREGKKWTAEVPGLPGCITWGTTKAEALALAEEAAEAWIASRRQVGRRLPGQVPSVELAKVRVG